MPAASPARNVAAVVIASLAAGPALLMYLPVPTVRLWLLHLIALEASLAIAVLALLAVVVGSRARPGVRRVVSVVAWTSFLAAAAPFAAVAPLYVRSGVPFSPSEYLRGVEEAHVEEAPGLVLDPASPALTADLYRGVGDGPRPFVVVVHGGAWRGGSRGEAPWTSRALARAGITVLDVSYRPSPATRFPAAVGDVKCELGRARERASELGLDPARAAILGRSAGGQIALVAAYSAGDPRVPPSCEIEDRPVRAVVGVYAPNDMAFGYEHPSRPDVVRGPEALRAYLDGTPAERPEAYRLATPESWVDGRALPPTLLVHGGLDRMVWVGHSERLARALEARRQGVRLLEIPLAEHGFDRRAGGLGEQLARGTIVPFLVAALAGP